MKAIKLSTMLAVSLLFGSNTIAQTPSLSVLNNTATSNITVGVEDKQGSYCYYSKDIEPGKQNDPPFQPASSFCSENNVKIDIWAKPENGIYTHICTELSNIDLSIGQDITVTDNGNGTYTCTTGGASFGRLKQ